MMAAERQPLSATGYALLGLLSFGRELSGYELKQWADGSIRFFYVSPAMSQVYSELDRLSEEGLVLTRGARRGERSVRLYRISKAGERELGRWVRDEPIDHTSLKHHLALRIFLGHLGSPEHLRDSIAEHSEWCERVLSDLKEVRENLGDDPTWTYPRLVAEWGLEYYESERRAMDRLLSALDSLC